MSTKPYTSSAPYAVAAGAKQRLFTGAGVYTFLLTATDPTALEVSFDGSSFDPWPAGIGFVTKADFVWVRNTSGSTNTVQLGMGNKGDFHDTRVVALTGTKIPVTIADGDGTSIGAKGDAAATDSTSSWSMIALLKGLWALMSAIGTALGGVLTSKPYATATNDWSYAAEAGGIINSTAAVTLKAAAGVGVRNYLTALQVEKEATTVVSEIVIRDGAGGTVLWRGVVSAGTINMIGNFVFPTPLRSSPNTLLEVCMLTATGVTGGVYVNAQGYVGA